MTFHEWYQAQPRGTSQRLIRDLKIGPSTIARLNEGKPVATYALAKKISDATDGSVSVADLCEPPALRIPAKALAKAKAAPKRKRGPGGVTARGHR